MMVVERGRAKAVQTMKTLLDGEFIFLLVVSSSDSGQRSRMDLALFFKELLFRTQVQFLIIKPSIAL